MKQIIAMGGGGFLMDESPGLDDFILSRAKGRESRVCFVGTASGDSDRMLVNFYTALGPRCRASHLALFRREQMDVTEYLLRHDVIYVGGGNSANMLAVWRVHGVDRALQRAHDAGVLLCGVSAGGLGMLPGYAADVGAALHFIDGKLAEVVASRPRATAYRMEKRAGEVHEQKLETRYLGGTA